MTDALAQLIAQAELQKIQIEISHRFAKNIALFEQRFPDIANKFRSHRPTKVELRLDNNKQLNLFHKERNTFVYAMAATEFCRRQVEEFNQAPFINRLRMGESPAYNQRHLHVKYLNELLAEYQQNDTTHLLSTKGIMTNLMMTGVGLGYQLPLLVEKLEIYNLFIYENSLDIFHASLHAIDWAPILDHFSQAGHSITFCLGVKPDRALNQIEQAVDKIGLHNHIYTFIYKHTKIPEETDFLKYYVKQIYASLGGLGFYDDEQIGLAHTIKNIQLDPPIFVTSSTPTGKLPPAMIIGNGPSLDIHEKFINDNKDNAVLFSCGTSFGSLSKFGLKPDFHVEMERTISMKDLLDFGTTEQDRQGVTLLCLNPVAPAVIESFEEHCIALKPNDVGEEIIAKHYSPKKMLKLPFSNPTVSNAALSFAISMGFTEIYLVGVDLGVSEQGQHHSINSPHYDLEEHLEDVKEAIYTYSEGDLEARGNFGGRVKTHATLDRARSSIERLIHYTKLAFPHFNCYNSNNGAYIEGAQPTKIANIPTFNNIDKNDIINNIKQRHFYKSKNKNFTKSQENTTIAHFLSIKNDLLLSENIKTERDLYMESQRVYAVIDKNNDIVSHMLMRGTINAFLGAITENSFYCVNSATFVEQVNKGVKKYNALIQAIYDNMHTEPFRLDDTHNTTLHRLNQQIEPQQRFTKQV